MTLCQCLDKFWDECREIEDLAFVQRGFTAEERQEVTYRQVNDWIQGLRDLVGRDVDWETVGINLAPFSIEETATMLLVAQQKRWLYVPIDVELPVARQLELLEKAGVRSVVTTVNSPLVQCCRNKIKGVQVKTMEKTNPFQSVQVITFMGGEESELEKTRLKLRSVRNKEELVAPLYVLFTSGTTGKPRGVLGTRIGAWTRLKWMWETYPFVVDTMGRTSERVVRATKLSFVDSVWEILGAFLQRVPLVHVQLPRDDSYSESIVMKSVVLDDSVRFLDVVRREKVTRFTAVPSVLELLLLQTTATERQSSFSGLRYVLSSGESLSIHVLQQFTTDLPHTTFLNLYGSTEISGDATCMEVNGPLSSTQVIEWEKTGVPIAKLDQRGVVGVEMSLLLLSDAAPKVIWPMKDANQGEKNAVSGVLYVSGPLVTLGYVADDRKDVFKTSEELGATDCKQSRLWLCTGDICSVIQGRLYFSGRKDNAVKIRGQLVHLEAVERAVAAALKETVESKQVDGRKVLALRVTRGAFRQQSIVVCVIYGGMSLSVSRYSNTRTLNAWIAEHYGASHVPHEMLRVDTNVVPRFANGKVHRRALKQVLADFYDKTSVSLTKSSIDGEADNPTEKLVVGLLKKILDIALSSSIHTQTFNELGGNSLLVTLFSHDLRQVFGTLPLTNQELLRMTIEEIILALESLPKKHSCEDQTGNVPNAVYGDNNELKRHKKTHFASPVAVEVTRGDTNQCRLAFLSRYNQSSNVNGFHLPTCYTSPIASGSLGLKSVWKIDLGKCIDASPLVVQRHDHKGRVSSTWAIVGSHSAQLVCVDVQAGREVWRVTLDDRIEACAALSVKHQLVYVGTYAGTFLALNLQSGETSWQFQARRTIKASALVLDALGLVVVGAYDNKLYALDVATGHMQWAMDLQGSIFSTPLYCAWSKQLFAASTNGNVVAFSSASDGAELTNVKKQWRLQLSAPVFAGLNAEPLSNIVLVGCADGNLYGVKMVSGEIQWKIPTEKPIFSSPCVYGTRSVVFGSHDGKLRKVDTGTGELQWATNLNSAVFASPTVVRLVSEPLDGGDSTLICCVTTTHGQLCFCDEKTGVIIYQTGDSSGENFETNGDLGPLFGSPVLVDNWCLLGTRTNYFFGLKLTS